MCHSSCEKKQRGTLWDYHQKLLFIFYYQKWDFDFYFKDFLKLCLSHDPELSCYSSFCISVWLTMIHLEFGWWLLSFDWVCWTAEKIAGTKTAAALRQLYPQLWSWKACWAIALSLRELNCEWTLISTSRKNSLRFDSDVWLCVQLMFRTSWSLENCLLNSPDNSIRTCICMCSSDPGRTEYPVTCCSGQHLALKSPLLPPLC